MLSKCYVLNDNFTTLNMKNKRGMHTHAQSIMFDLIMSVLCHIGQCQGQKDQIHQDHKYLHMSNHRFKHIHQTQ